MTPEGSTAMRYTMQSGERPNLPPFIEGTTELYAYQRPNTLLACVESPIDVELDNLGLFGDLTSKVWLLAGNFHVATPGRQHFPVSLLDVARPGEVNNEASYHLSQAPLDCANSPLAASLDGYWRFARRQVVQVYGISRVKKALVVGQIAFDAEPGMLHTDGGEFTADPGAFIIAELSGRGVRVISWDVMAWEFSSIGTQENAPIETFVPAA